MVAALQRAVWPGPAYAAAMPNEGPAGSGSVEHRPPGSRRPTRPAPTDDPPPEAPHRPGWVPAAATGDGARPAWALPAALVAMAVVYPAAFYFQVVPFWSAMVAFSAFSWWAAWHPYLRTRLRPTRRLVLMGLVSGVALYLCFCAGAVVVQETPLWPRSRRSWSWPGRPPRGGRRRGDRPGHLAERGGLAGAVFARLTGRYGLGWPLAATTALYGLFVGLSGNPALLLAALVCGAVWTRQRQVTGSIVPSLVSHVLWSLLMFLYVPGLGGL